MMILRKIGLLIGSVILLTIGSASFAVAAPGSATTPSAGGPCKPGVGAIEFLPTWYEYLPGTYRNGTCEIDTSDMNGTVVTLILLAIVNILMWFGSIAAVVFIVYGGFMFVTSQGEPGKLASARKTILNAVIGLIITLLASQLVKFVAGFLTKQL